MSDKVQQVKDQRGLFERVVSYIPGYHGYKEKEVRRETDRLVRATAASFLGKALDEYRKPLVSLALPDSDRDAADSLLARLDTVREKTARALAGYSGLFDSVKIKEDKLDRLVELDSTLVESSKALYESCRAVSSKPTLEGFRIGSASVRESLEKVEEALDGRDALLRSP